MYLDLEYQVRTDGQFRDGLIKRAQRLEQATSSGRESASYAKNYNDALWDLIRFCRFNLVFLTPYYFPRYPKDKPLNFADYPFAFQMFNFVVGGFSVFRGSRQIAKSTSFTVRQLMNARLIPGFRSTYICPRNQQLQTYAGKLREVERASRFYDSDMSNRKTLRKNLNLKEYHNKSLIELIYVLTSASPVRGKSSDELLFDEYQDFDPDLEIEVCQIQSASPIPVSIYAGTSLTTESALEQKYEESSMGVWITKCEACNHDNIPLLEYRVLDMIQPDGPSCIKCGRLLDIRRGRFIHQDRQAFDRERYGYHIPQIIVPSVVFNPRRWAEIYDMKCRLGGNRKFLQEILGIPVEQGEREITKKDLQEICTLGRDLHALQQKAINRGFNYVVSGCDWGGSDYIPADHIKISTTVHVMAGITSTGEIHIIHIRRYLGMNYDDIAGDILYNHKKLNGTIMCSDVGVGQYYNTKLREQIAPEQHLMFGYVGPETALIAEPKKAHAFNQWSLNKTESISMTYDAIRSKRIKCFAWEMAEEYLSDFMNMFRAPAEKAGSGATTFLYRAHPSKPNDTLQAVNYVHMGTRVLLGEPMFADLSMKLRLDQMIRSRINLGNFQNLPQARAFSG